MPASKMALFFSFLTLFGVFVAGGLGAASNAAYSNGVTTETAAPQELGSTTFSGSLVYSLNICTIVRSVNCATSMSTGGPAPSAAKTSTSPSTSGFESGSRSGSVLGTSGAFKLTTTEVEGPYSTVYTTTNSAGNSIKVTHAESSALATGKTNESAPAQSKGQQSSGGTPLPVPTSAGASNIVDVVPNLALGITIMGLAVLF